MTKRLASIVTLKHQPGQRYLVAHGCPHARPNDAPFYACMASMEIANGERVGEMRLAKCGFLLATDEKTPDRFEIHCAHDVSGAPGPADDSVQIGALGIPTVAYAPGDSDGGEPD